MQDFLYGMQMHGVSVWCSLLISIDIGQDGTEVLVSLCLSLQLILLPFDIMNSDR